MDHEEVAMFPKKTVLFVFNRNGSEVRGAVSHSFEAEFTSNLD